jgi:hypothetical protein
MISGVHLEVVLAGSYAIFFVAVAFALEMVARHSHKRSERYRNSGFVYFHKMDLWECPAGRQLLRSGKDHQRRPVHYRAPAEACNACSLKKKLHGFRRRTPRLESELRRFHRGISLVLLLLATIILLAETAQHAEPRESLIVGGLLIPLGIAETKLFSAFLTRQGSYVR